MAKLKLGPVNHGTDKNRYCGPSVISAVTSLTTGEAARLIRMQSGKRSVKGTSTLEVKRALKACNIEMHHVPSPGQTRFGRSYGITLAHWLRITHGTRADRVFLVVAGWHWQLISGNRYVCGRIASLGIVSVKHEQVKRRARVAEVYELTSTTLQCLLWTLESQTRTTHHGPRPHVLRRSGASKLRCFLVIHSRMYGLRKASQMKTIHSTANIAHIAGGSPRDGREVR